MPGVGLMVLLEGTTQMRSLVIALTLFSSSLLATPLSVTLSGPGGRQATASFAVSGTNLVVTLSNSSAIDALVPVDVLTAVFFKLQGVGSLTPVSAVLASGSIVQNDPAPVGGIVGGEFAYVNGGAGLAALGYDQGISSSGLGIFGNPNFPGTNLEPPNAVDGLQYGITTAGDNVATTNGGLDVPLIKNAVVFTLSGLAGGFTEDNLQLLGIRFQYGTALDEPYLTPEPGFYGLLALGFAGVFIVAMRRKNATEAA